MNIFKFINKGIVMACALVVFAPSQAKALTINLIYDSYVTSSPYSSQIQAAVNKAAQFLQSTYSNPITVNIQIGWGEILGYTVTSLGASDASWHGYYTMSAMENALLSMPQSSNDTLAYAHFPPASLYSSTAGFWLTTAQQKTLGLIPANSASIDGYVGFASGYSYTFDDTNGVAGGTYDLVGVALHELSEVLGRMSGTPQAPDLADMFRYSAPGVPMFTTGPAYFSIDGGVTDLCNYNAASSGDLGDWAVDALSTGDAASAFAYPGVTYTFTPTDITLLDVAGYSTTTPGAPSNLTASTGDTQVALSWKASSNASSYNVMRSSNGSAMASIASVTSLNYTDTAVTNGTAYTYGITAVNAVGTSPMSNQVTAIPNPPQPPAAPANLSASAGNAQVALSWQASVNATFYNVLRSSNGSAMNAVATVNALTYMDTSAANGTTYTYAVVAGNTAGTSGMSNQVSATPVAPVQVVPPAPSGLRALVGKSGNKRNPTYKVNLSWTQSGSASITQEKIYRTPAWSTGSPKVISAATAYTDSPVTHGTTYTYYVTAVNAAGESAPSNTVTATP